MIYSTSKCPKCGQIIRRQTNPVHEIGNPFERCRHCGNIYLNSYKEEWITKSPIKRFFFFLQVYVWARAVLMPVLLMIIPIAIFDIDMDSEIVAILWPILSIVWLLVGYFVHKNANKKEIEASLSRTKDPEYRNLLKKAGYKIYPVENYTPSNNTQIYSSPDINTSDAPRSVPHICLSPNNGNDSKPIAMSNMAIQRCDDKATSSETPQNTSIKERFSITEMAGGMAEICIHELLDIMGICAKHNVSYNEKKLIVATFAYFYTIWIFNFENIIAHQADKLEEIYKEKFSLFNRKQYENEPFKDVIENEQLLAETMVRVDKRVRNSYHFNNHTFVDDGISDEFILEFAEGQETKELIKPEIVIKILKDWAAKATLAGKEIEITDS